MSWLFWIYTLENNPPLRDRKRSILGEDGSRLRLYKPNSPWAGSINVYMVYGRCILDNCHEKVRVCFRYFGAHWEHVESKYGSHWNHAGSTLETFKHLRNILGEVFEHVDSFSKSQVKVYRTLIMRGCERKRNIWYKLNSQWLSQLCFKLLWASGNTREKFYVYLC